MTYKHTLSLFAVTLLTAPCWAAIGDYSPFANGQQTQENIQYELVKQVGCNSCDSGCSSCQAPSCGCEQPSCGCEIPQCGCDVGCGDGCCDSGCGGGCGGYGGCCEKSFFDLGCQSCQACCWCVTGGIEATFLRPTTSARPLAFFGAQTRRSDLARLDEFYVAPRMWIGLENNCGRGFRARYWELNAFAHGRELTLNGAFNQPTRYYAAESDLQAYLIDLDYTQRLRYNCWNLLGSIGVTHGALERHESLTVFDAASASMSDQRARRSFHGTGISIGLQGRRQLYSPCFHLFFNTRASFLWGDNRSDSIAAIAVNGTPSSQSYFRSNTGTDMFVLNAQLGLEYRRMLCGCNCEFFARAAVEYQHWNADGPEFDFTNTATNGGTTFTTRTYSRDLDVDLVGLALATGLTW